MNKTFRVKIKTKKEMMETANTEVVTMLAGGYWQVSFLEDGQFCWNSSLEASLDADRCIALTPYDQEKYPFPARIGTFIKQSAMGCVPSIPSEVTVTENMIDEYMAECSCNKQYLVSYMYKDKIQGGVSFDNLDFLSDGLLNVKEVRDSIFKCKGIDTATILAIMEVERT